MSVVIVAPQSKLPSPARTSNAPAPADNASPTDTAVKSADFASLLLGQLAAGTEMPAAAPVSVPLQTEDNNITEAAPQDAAQMLATLGMAPVEPTPKTIDMQQAEKTDGSFLQGVNVTAPDASLKITPENSLKTGQEIVADGKSGSFVLPVTTGAEEKAAKVAVADFALPKAEPLPIGKIADDLQATSTAAISPNALAPTQRSEGSLKVETPVHDRTWASDFNQKVVWLATNDKQSAQLTLNPPQMGPIEISLNINKDGASAFFVSPNAEVREAIETALPRLREMLAGVGIELGQANVSAESFRQQAGNESARQGTPRWQADNAILGNDSTRGLLGQSITAQRGNSLVDIFA